MNKILLLGLLLVAVFAIGIFVSKDVNNAKNQELTNETEQTRVEGKTNQASKVNGNVAYVALGPANKIGVIDLDTNKIIEKLPAGKNSHGIALAGGNIFTTGTKMGPKEMKMEPDHDDGEVVDMKKMMSFGSNEITVTNLDSREIIKTIDVGGGTHHMVASSDGKFVLATIPSLKGVVVIDATTLSLSSIIETGALPNYVVASPNGALAYVSNKGEDTVAVVDIVKGETIARIKTGVRPDHMVLSKDGSKLYVTNAGSDDVSVIDTEKGIVIATIPVGETPHGIGISPDGGAIYVSNTESKDVTVINTNDNTVTASISVGTEIEHLEVVDNGDVLVNNEDGGEIFVLDIEQGTVSNTIELGAQPHQTIVTSN